MSYTKQDFKNGQVLKAEQLNYIEDGITSLLSLHEGNYLIRYTVPAESDEFEFTFTCPKGKKERALIYFYDPNAVCGAKVIYDDTSILGSQIKQNPEEITANGEGTLRIRLSCNVKAEDTDFEVLIIDPDADTVESFLVNQIVAEKKAVIETLHYNIGMLEDTMRDYFSYVQPNTIATNPPTRAGELCLVNEKDLYISVYSEEFGEYIWSNISHATSITE